MIMGKEGEINSHYIVTDWQTKDKQKPMTAAGKQGVENSQSTIAQEEKG